MRLVHGMYANAQNQVHIGESHSQKFEVEVGVHQEFVLSPLLFIFVLVPLSCEFQSRVPWEDLYADDLVIIADSLEECVRKLLIWKEVMKSDKLVVVSSFCFLGDILLTGRDCELAVTTVLCENWKKTRELLPVLTSRHISFKTCGHDMMGTDLVCMIRASETWALTKMNLQCNDRAMIRQICLIKPEDVATVESSKLLSKLEGLDLI